MELLIIIIVLFDSILLVLYLAKPDFSGRKVRLMNLYSSLLSDMNLDFKSVDIGANNISDISKSIQNFTEEIDRMNELVKKENEENRKWFLDMIVEFNMQLHLWIDRHRSELEGLEINLKGLQAHDVGGKSVLELASKRIESHIQVLSRI